ncbi:SRPBCC family protein [Tenacibaculum dicentrarchi]|uniref:Orotate phosphoribosyltransferase n=1 Tax=Tenacibaculum dicentrarchi TaxID=669041 RepID=A0ABM9NYY5_9FLAO|nr:SRPBCC family protein [Tenacibaculum dicentrarchi]MCD8415345.1 SRPBCC family protein [Tenacibaculum dicentrarchi]MCD8420553.1 SRPBCC family protein [Tenacibaculum dicentrarchi]MCD8441045.1 SRPBCC family protein [Tenacibaculum dicentrarchi]MCD8448133.1 SRPBCC family protein [Tenacibaculum dicentrarchi]
MNIAGKKVIVQKSTKEIFDFLMKLENFEQLMPENTQKFEVDGDSFIFGLKGMPEIRLVIKEKTEFSNITLGAASSKLPFTLSSDICEVSEKESEVILNFNGEFNPMMAMMVKKPLTKFIDTLTENISKL